MKRLAISAAMLLVAACSDPSVTSCADRLGGIWVDGERSYHITDDGRAIEVFELEANDRADSSAGYVRVEREDEALAGFHQVFRHSGRKVCRVRTPAAIDKCTTTSLELRIGVAGDIDFATCVASATGGEKRLALSRRKALP